MEKVGFQAIPSANCPRESVLPIRLRPDFSFVLKAYAGQAERDRLAALKVVSFRAIAGALCRAAPTISRELRRNALDSGAYRPHVADGAYMLRRQRAAVLERDAKLAAYVTDRLAEGWTPEQIAGRLRLGIETGLRAVCPETIYGRIYRGGRKTGGYGAS